jgi:hypothetical protein
VFAAPLAIRHERHADFPAVYRLVGALAFFISVLSLAEWSGRSFLPLETKYAETLYEFVGLAAAAGGIGVGIARQWDGVVNTSSVFFTIFLFTRLYHWWWDWMPKYLFFALIGAIAILLMLAFKRLRTRLA